MTTMDVADVDVKIVEITVPEVKPEPEAPEPPAIEVDAAEISKKLTAMVKRISASEHVREGLIAAREAIH